MEFYTNKFMRPLLWKFLKSNNKFNVRYSSKYYTVDDDIFGLNKEQKEVSKIRIEFELSDYTCILTLLKWCLEQIIF